MVPLDETCSGHNWRTLYCVHCGATIQVIVDCGHRFCPFCGKRRARRIRDRLGHLLKSFQKIPDARVKMLTLSTANCSNLDDGIRHLVASFRRLRQRKLWKRYVFGGAFVIEITGSPGNWHPHIHAVLYSYFIPWALLRSAWSDVSGGTAVWIKDVSDERAKYYVTKYLTKPDCPAVHLDVVSASLRQFRLFSRFGDWHNIVLPKAVYDAPCRECGRSDWIIDLKISHGHWRDMRPGEPIPPRASLARGAKIGAEPNTVAPMSPLRAARELNPPPLLLELPFADGSPPSLARPFPADVDVFR